jgi:hypothetical protein
MVGAASSTGRGPVDVSSGDRAGNAGGSPVADTDSELAGFETETFHEPPKNRPHDPDQVPCPPPTRQII